MEKLGEVNANGKGERFAIREYKSSTEVDMPTFWNFSRCAGGKRHI